jgi:hypothetical protein
MGMGLGLELLSLKAGVSSISAISGISGVSGISGIEGVDAGAGVGIGTGAGAVDFPLPTAPTAPTTAHDQYASMYGALTEQIAQLKGQMAAKAQVDICYMSYVF